MINDKATCATPIDPLPSRRLPESAVYGRRKVAALCAAFAFFALALLPGCYAAPDFTPETNPEVARFTPSDLTYREVAERYNETVAQFETLFLRTYVRLVWQETRANGETRIRREAGDGKFLFRSPRDTVLTIEKISKVYLWAGSNSSQYWLFDQVDDDHKIAYIGRYDPADLTQGSAGRLPIAFRPDAVPYLLGLVPLDPELEATVYLYEGMYLVEPEGMGLRMLLNPRSFRPTRVDLLDSVGWSTVVCELSGGHPVEVAGVDSLQRPSICSDAKLFIIGQQSSMSIEMIDATTDDRRIRDQLFTLDTLLEALKPNEVIDLDAR